MSSSYIPDEDRIDVIGKLTDRLEAMGDQNLRAAAEQAASDVPDDPDRILKPFKDEGEKDKESKEAPKEQGEKDTKEVKDEGEKDTKEVKDEGEKEPGEKEQGEKEFGQKEPNEKEFGEKEEGEKELMADEPFSDDPGETDPDPTYRDQRGSAAPRQPPVM
jgi:hypothetical protein